MDFRVNAVSLTGPEVEAIKNKIYKLESPGENRELQEKLEKLSIAASVDH